jgi:hypothetical protein
LTQLLKLLVVLIGLGAILQRALPLIIEAPLFANERLPV